MNTTILEDLGLSKGEIKVYIALLELSSSTAGPIIKKSGLQSSVVYNCIHSLQEKGLVTFVVHANIKHYQATDPENLVDFIDDKKSELKKLIPELSRKQESSQNIQTATVYTGFKGLMTMYNDLFKNAKKNDHYLAFTVGDEHYNPEVQRFFKVIDRKRYEKGLKTLLIAPIFLKKPFKKAYPDKYFKVKYIDHAYPTGTCVIKDYIAHLIFKPNPQGILIHSKDMAHHYKEFFWHMWKIAEA